MATSDTKVQSPPRALRAPARASGPMTLREFTAFERGRPDAERWELVEGEPLMAPSPSMPHQQLVSLLVVRLAQILTEANGWCIAPDTSLRLSSLQSEVRPDVAAYRQSDLKDPGVFPLRATPRLVIECLSPGSAHYDLNEKLHLYHKAGVPEYWVVDPKTGDIKLFIRKKNEYEQLSVDPEGFIASPLLKRKLRIVVRKWNFEVLEK